MPLLESLAAFGPQIGSYLGSAGGGAALGSAIQAGTPYAFQGLKSGWDWLRGNKPEESQRNQILDSIMQQLNQPNQADFGPIRQDATRHFQEEILPMIREQYAGVRSGVPQLLQERAGQDLSTRLAALQQQFAQQNQQQNLQRLGQQEQLLRGNQQYGLQRANMDQQRAGLRQQGQMMPQQQRSGQIRDLLGAYQQTQVPVGSIYHQRQPGFPEAASQQGLPALGRLGISALTGV